MAWWLASAGSAAASVDVDDGEDIIDLTSDTEVSPYSPPAARASTSDGAEPISPRTLKAISDMEEADKEEADKQVKREGKKRAVEAGAMAAPTGEVQLTSKPADRMDMIERPGKRTKMGKGVGVAAAGDDDLELVGTTGSAKLPHNRFACTEHTFGGWHGSSNHKEKCSLCYCYVCDRPAGDCREWNDHCHATDSGPMKAAWKSLRERAKVLLQGGKHPPVSHRYGSSPSPSPSSSALSNTSTPSFTPSPSSSGSGSGLTGLAGLSYLLYNVGSLLLADYEGAHLAHLPNACNCEELCKPVHHVFQSNKALEPSRAKAAVVYLNGLTPEQVQHVEDISIKTTVDRAVDQKYLPMRRLKQTAAAKTALLARFESEIKPAVRVVVAGPNRRNVTVVGMHVDSRNRRAFSPKWTPGQTTVMNAAVRLGGVDDIRFSMNSTLGSHSERKEYFDRFVSENPMPLSVWYSTTRPTSASSPAHEFFENGPLVLAKREDAQLLELLKSGYEKELLDVEATATFDPATNTGSFSLEVILLKQVFRRGTSMASRSFDFVPLVERLVLGRIHNPSAVTASLKKKAREEALTPKPRSAIVDGGTSASSAAPPVGIGLEFTPSKKGYGGSASLDVTLGGLIDSVRQEESNQNIALGSIIHPAKMLLELENLQHRSLPTQPECLTVQLYEHQKQDAQWMYDQEMLTGGTMQHLWAEIPPHRLAPVGVPPANEFRRCWFSPIMNQFTFVNPLGKGVKGGILCDEMGLGKTAATLVLHLIHPAKTPSPGVPLDENEWGRISGNQADVLNDKNDPEATEPPAKFVSKGTLVVCKVSLVGQWVEEAKRLSGGKLTIYPYHGGGRVRNPAFLAKFDMVVTTYGVVQADQSRNGGYPPLRRIRWWRVVLDESHTIAGTNRASRDVMCLVSNRRWCMTGTPYISRFSDVNAQLAFIGAEGAFRSFDLGDKGANPETQGETVAFLRRVLLRHSQGMQLGGKSILGLPTITHKVEVLTMPTREREAYQEFEKSVQSDYCKVRYRLRNNNGSYTMEVLTLLSKFRQACSGGQLLIGDTAASGGSGDSGTASVDAFCSICNEILESPVTTMCGHTFCQACITSALTKTNNDGGPCPKCKKAVSLQDLTAVGGGSSHGIAKLELSQRDSGGGSSSSGGSAAGTPGVVMETKLEALVQKLADIHAKDPTSKSLVFSQFNSSLEWLTRTLPKRGFQFRTLTGSMSRTQRTAALTAFADDPPTTVFLLSVRSGAVGINLTQANNVFLLEPLLNLALEKQAIGRVYRLGQARPVTVTKLVLKDSIETRILALQKKQAAEGSASAAVGAAASGSSNGVAGNIARDNAKNLKIEEYNALFGVSEAAEGVDAQKRRLFRQQELLAQRKKAKKENNAQF